MAFTNEQMERYSRHIILQEVGVKGQKKLLNAKVLIIGAGGLGAPAAMYLAAAGVGTIGIVDADEVDLSNLQRQIIHELSVCDHIYIRVHGVHGLLCGFDLCLAHTCCSVNDLPLKI